MVFGTFCFKIWRNSQILENRFRLSHQTCFSVKRCAIIDFDCEKKVKAKKDEFVWFLALFVSKFGEKAKFLIISSAYGAKFVLPMEDAQYDFCSGKKLSNPKNIILAVFIISRCVIVLKSFLVIILFVRLL